MRNSEEKPVVAGEGVKTSENVQSVGGGLSSTTAITGRVVAHILRGDTGTVEVVQDHNIVTDDGDIYYAERGGNAATPTAPTNFTAGLVFDGVVELFNGASSAPAKGNQYSAGVGAVANSVQAIDGTYPQLNDGDARNTGAGVDIITYRVSYTAGQIVATGIADVLIRDPGGSPVGTDPILMHSELTPFNLTASDTLTLFVNHRMNGV